MRPTKDNLITRSAVSKRPDWTLGLVVKLLGEPDERRKVRGLSNLLCLYKLERVVAAETSDNFRIDIEKRRRRKQSAAQAVDTKTANLLAEVATMRISVAEMPIDKATEQAIRHYNFRQQERWLDGREGGELARPDSAPHFLERITVNYLRHQMTRYDHTLEAMVGRTGNSQAIVLLRQRIYEAISAAYPSLKTECDRQLKERCTPSGF